MSTDELPALKISMKSCLYVAPELPPPPYAWLMTTCACALPTMVSSARLSRRVMNFADMDAPRNGLADKRRMLGRMFDTFLSHATIPADCAELRLIEQPASPTIARIVRAAPCRVPCAGSLIARRRENRDFFAVVIQLLRAHVARGRAHARKAGFRLVEPLFHRQLEIEDRAVAPALLQPMRDQFGDAARLLDHVADQPVHRLGRTVAETILAPVCDESGIQQRAIHRAVVDGGNADRAAHELIRPAAGRGAEIHRGHAGLEPARAFVIVEQGQKCLFELERGAARRRVRKFQARNALRPRRAGIRIGCAQVYFVALWKKHVQAAWCARIEQLRFLQGADEGIAEALAQRRK